MRINEDVVNKVEIMEQSDSGGRREKEDVEGDWIIIVNHGNKGTLEGGQIITWCEHENGWIKYYDVQYNFIDVIAWNPII